MRSGSEAYLCPCLTFTSFIAVVKKAVEWSVGLDRWASRRRSGKACSLAVSGLKGSRRKKRTPLRFVSLFNDMTPWSSDVVGVGVVKT